MKHFSERLRHIRKLRQLSQANLARLCGLSQSAISNFENGTRRDPREILELARALNVSPTWLKDGLGPMNRPVEGGSNFTLEDPGSGMPIVSWPFTEFSVDEIVALDAEHRRLLEQTVRHLLNGMKSK